MTAKSPLYQLQHTADGFNTLFHSTYGQTYHSRHGARTEAMHVFLAGAGVVDRLIKRLPTKVLEVGFGTGLNFLLTAHQAASTSTPLQYVALEKEVLSHEMLAALNHGARCNARSLQDALLAWRRSLPAVPPPGSYTHAFSDMLSLDLIVGDATETSIPAHAYDAIYLDAFSPEGNPELWTPAFLSKLLAVMRPGGMLATYSAKGAVRRTLETLGFDVEKRPGPPGKREMIVAKKVA